MNNIIVQRLHCGRSTFAIVVVIVVFAMAVTFVVVLTAGEHLRFALVSSSRKMNFSPWSRKRSYVMDAGGGAEAQDLRLDWTFRWRRGSPQLRPPMSLLVVDEAS